MNFLGGNEQLTTVIDSIHRALDQLVALDLTPDDSAAGTALVVDVEALGTRIDSLQTSLVGVIETSGVHAVDAFTPKSFISHNANTSKTEAAARHRTMRALRDLPAIAAAYEAAEITTDVVRRIARAHANPRVRAALIDAESEILERVVGASYPDVDDMLTDWTRVVDEGNPSGSLEFAPQTSQTAPVIATNETTRTGTSRCCGTSTSHGPFMADSPPCKGPRSTPSSTTSSTPSSRSTGIRPSPNTASWPAGPIWPVLIGNAEPMRSTRCVWQPT